MKKSGFLWLTMIWGSLLWSGCSKDDLDTYDPSRNSIYFGMLNPSSATNNVFVDTTLFSFADHEGVTDTVIQIQVNALGGFFNEPREFEYEIVDSLTTAVEGVHFTLPEEKKGIVPAQDACGYIPVHVLYSAGMKDRPVWYLALQLKPTKDFNLDLKLEYVDKNNNEYVQLTRHWLGMSSRIQKPERWYQIEQYFLDFSEDKYKLISQLCHLRKQDWDEITFYIAETYWIVVRNYLQKRIDEGNPVMVRDERTSRMKPMEVKGLTGIKK